MQILKFTVRPSWFAIAFGLSMLHPCSGIFASLLHACAGRVYVAYFLAMHSWLYIPIIKHFIESFR